MYWTYLRSKITYYILSLVFCKIYTNFVSFCLKQEKNDLNSKEKQYFFAPLADIFSCFKQKQKNKTKQKFRKQNLVILLLK